MKEPKSIIIRDLITTMNFIERCYNYSIRDFVKHPLASLFYFFSFGVILNSFWKWLGGIWGFIVAILMLVMFGVSYNYIKEK